jgi:hypothetical protein
MVVKPAPRYGQQFGKRTERVGSLVVKTWLLCPDKATVRYVSATASSNAFKLPSKNQNQATVTAVQAVPAMQIPTWINVSSLPRVSCKLMFKHCLNLRNVGVSFSFSFSFSFSSCTCNCFFPAEVMSLSIIYLLS